MTSLMEMLSLLEHLERVQDGSDEITPQMIADHFDQVKEVDKKVDSLYNFMSMCKANSAMYSERAEMYEKKSDKFDKLYLNLQNYVLFLLDRFPDIEFRGNDVVFKKRLNPFSLNCPITKSQSFSNIVPDEAILGVPGQYLRKKEVWILDTELVKKDLQSGAVLDFARLDRKSKLVTDFKLKGDNHANK